MLSKEVYPIHFVSFSRCQSIPLSQRMRIGNEVALAMNYLHCNNPIILHWFYNNFLLFNECSDLTTNNILVTEELRAKVTDFGLARTKRAKSTQVRKSSSANALDDSTITASPDPLVGTPAVFFVKLISILIS